MTEAAKNKLQLLFCRTPILSYALRFRSARRYKAGQRQAYCLTCKRWKWPDQLCRIADVRREP